jgi:hypothetical protein
MPDNDDARRQRIASAQRLYDIAQAAVADARVRLMEADRTWRQLGDRALLDSAQREMNTCMNILSMRERDLQRARSS